MLDIVRVYRDPFTNEPVAIIIRESSSGFLSFSGYGLKWRGSGPDLDIIEMFTDPCSEQRKIFDAPGED